MTITITPAWFCVGGYLLGVLTTLCFMLYMGAKSLIAEKRK